MGITNTDAALRWLLAVVTELQNKNDENFDAEAWQTIADDLLAVSEYAQGRANTLGAAESEE